MDPMQVSLFHLIQEAARSMSFQTVFVVSALWLRESFVVT